MNGFGGNEKDVEDRKNEAAMVNFYGRAMTALE